MSGHGSVFSATTRFATIAGHNNGLILFVVPRPGKVGIDGRGHEKVDEEVINRLKGIFGQPTQAEQNRRHESDVNTTWFGVMKEANQPYLHYSNRLVEILNESRVVDHSERFPQLVSFVGQTGAGKSTVIKMLISGQQARAGNTADYATPVPGLVGDNIPTTGDVHLYEDPGTYFAQKPIFYADCEGMTGGENAPRGLAHREKMDGGKKPRQFMKNKQKKLKKKLAWADDPSTQSREYAVTSLFPRILYTFSDVVVFVLREVRTFQTEVLMQLVNWAAKSIDKSINQPSLPHLVIVLNATETSIDEKQWNIETATRGLLDDYQESVHQVSALQDILARLEALGKGIKTTKDLLEYYYSSVTVVRIPAKGRYMKIDEQIGKLYDTINRKCALSHAQKKRIRMLLNAEMLPRYVNSAYDHFSRRLDEPFDFAEEARRHAPLPQDFSGHILNLMLSMYNSYDRRNGRVRAMFTKLSRPIASCVILAATRDKTQGLYTDLLRNTYIKPLSKAFEEFCDHWMHCSFERDGDQCYNVRNSHKKGHQAHTGKILGRGQYTPPFDIDNFFPTWLDEIDRHVRALDDRLQQFAIDREEGTIIPSIHRDVMATFYRNAERDRPVSSFKSNSTCLCCVRKIPENELPCGHILCKTCVQSYGVDAGQGLYKLYGCPLHDWETRWPQPARIRFKPEEAGVRVLCLDGGGVRGIIELLVLQAIEEALGSHVRIQNFFDLIVGSSTGGIIALGLGVKHWSVDQCMSHFRGLCGQAFTSRPFKPITVISHKSYYKTKPLERALQSVFDEHSLLYGGSKPENSTAIRVAVTSTSENRPVVMSNYNTEGERDALPYRFVRPQDPATELKIWEAARATAASPRYFKPFIQAGTMAAYTDGAVHHNCPVLVADYERRLLWGEVKDWPPDFFLSIGTGRSIRTRSQSTGLLSPGSPDNPRPRSPRTVSDLRNKLRTASSIDFDNQLNCEEIWRRYHDRAVALDQLSRAWDSGRNMRINVDFEGARPSLDDVKEVPNIERHTISTMKHNPEIYEAAHRLVASCFYFEKTGSDSQNRGAGQYKCVGNIRCRFDEGSNDLQGLGRILRDYIHGTHSMPFFFLEENFASRDHVRHEVPIPPETIETMCHLGIFQLPTNLEIDGSSQSSLTRLSLCLQQEGYRHHHNRSLFQGSIGPLFSLSGFPRELFAPEALSSPTMLQEEPGSDCEEISELPAVEISPPAVQANGSSSDDADPSRSPSIGERLWGRGNGGGLYKSLSQLSMRSKASIPGEKEMEAGHGRGAQSVDLGSSPRLGAGSGGAEPRSSIETADGRLEGDSGFHQDSFYSRTRY
ncbi:hypothetical protein ACJ41O_001956 [Fusarium nematophilum]